MIIITKKALPRILSLIVIVAGLLVICGWLLNISIFKSISLSLISIKLSTAAAFVLSGILLYFIAGANKNEFDFPQIIISIITFILILLMGVLFFSSLLGLHTGIEDFLVKDTAENAKTVVPGRPSIPTMLGFLLVSLAGILTILNPEKLYQKLKILGLLIGLIGAVAIAGYIVNIPILYYYLEGLNSAMSIYTAVLLITLGVGFQCLSD